MSDHVPPPAPRSLSPVPEILSGVLDAMRFRRCAGEWDLEVRPPAPTLTAQLQRLIAAFPWIDVRSMDVAGAAERASWSRADSPEPAATWLARWEGEQREGVQGLEATLDLALAWIDDHGSSGRSMFAQAARWFIDQPSAIQVLTVWPNLFTDEILLYTPVGDLQFASRPFAFASAAQRNRQQLTDSLRQWESTSGAILSCDSALVDAVTKHGVAPSGQSR